MPIQAGSDAVLKRMRRLHTKEDYYRLVERIREKIPNVALSSDFIVGFCGETEEDFQHTLEVSRNVKFEQNFMFKYSMRDKTHAYHKLKDDVPEEVKQNRLERLIETAREGQVERNLAEKGKFHVVLVEKEGKREGTLRGRTDTNKMCVFEDKEIKGIDGSKSKIKEGDYVIVKVDSSSSVTLFAEAIEKTSISRFYSKENPLNCKI